MKNLFYSILTFLACSIASFGNFTSDIALLSASKTGAIKSMAKIKMGALVVDMRGKLGGHVASKNRNGNYLRTKVTPSNPQSVAQSAVRNSFTTNAQAWRGITTAQRSAWRSAVGNFVKTNIFGDAKTLSGFQLYMAINNNLLLVGESVIAVPPVPSAVPAFLTMSASVVNGVDAVDITFTGAIAATEKAVLYATAGQSAGKDFFKSEYRIIHVLDNADTSVFDALALYIAKFGSLPAIGQKIAFKMEQVQVATGIKGATIFAQSIVV